MKTLVKYTAMALFSLILFNCNSDDEENVQQEPTVSELIIGKWFLKEIDDIIIPEGCLDQTYYHFLDEQNIISEHFSDFAGSDCDSSGAYTSSYSINQDNEVVFNIQDEFGITPVTFKIINISTTELLGTYQIEDSTRNYKLIK